MHFFIVMTSKVFVTSGGLVSYMPFKKDQFVIDTWHGGGAYKYIGLDLYNDFFYRTEVKWNAKRTSLFLSSCKKFSEVVERTLLIDTHRILEIGMPRNDILLSENTEKIRERVKRKLGIDSKMRVILYAPTYRNAGANNQFLKAIPGEYSLDYNRILVALSNRFGGDWCFAFRYHMNVDEKESGKLPEGVFNFSGYEDMQELICTADIMINDYSSSIWDFSLTGKPCFIFARDIAKYKKERNLYTQIEEWPFPIAETNEELEANILSFDELEYANRIKKHHTDLGICETGKATKIVGEKIYSICTG